MNLYYFIGILNISTFRLKKYTLLVKIYWFLGRGNLKLRGEGGGGGGVL